MGRWQLHSVHQQWPLLSSLVELIVLISDGIPARRLDADKDTETLAGLRDTKDKNTRSVRDQGSCEPEHETRPQSLWLREEDERVMMAPS